MRAVFDCLIGSKEKVFILKPSCSNNFSRKPNLVFIAVIFFMLFILNNPTIVLNNGKSIGNSWQIDY